MFLSITKTIFEKFSIIFINFLHGQNNLIAVNKNFQIFKKNLKKTRIFKNVNLFRKYLYKYCENVKLLF